jgi:ADP-heptose:LPS heptosyltransferase
MEHLIRQKEKILRRCKERKSAIVVRYGAIGDLVMVTPVLRQLKKEGYFVIANIHNGMQPVLTCNPNIDAYLLQKTNEVPQDKLSYYWKKLSYGVDKFINLSESIEGSLLRPEGRASFHSSKEKRHEECNVNYMDQTMDWAGYPEMKGEQPELFFSKSEHKYIKKFLRKYEGYFVVLISLSGSSIHKAYPYMEHVVTQFLENYSDTVAITVGDIACKLLEWDHPRTLALSGNIKLRKSLILTQYADLVIGTETGILNAASCFDTPKIVLLSHSSIENLTKYWKNCESVEPNVHCYPCHQLHYTKESCPLNSKTESPLCATMIRPEQVLLRMEDFYNQKKRKVA